MEKAYDFLDSPKVSAAPAGVSGGGK
jgi:hypothetical protein